MVELYGNISIFDLDHKDVSEPLEVVTNESNTQATIEKAKSMLEYWKQIKGCDNITTYHTDNGMVFRLFKDKKPINIFASVARYQ